LTAFMWKDHTARASTHTTPIPAVRPADTVTGHLARFQDTIHHTRLIVQTDAKDVDAGIFTFVLVTQAQTSVAILPTAIQSQIAQFHGGNTKDLTPNGNGQFTLSYQGPVELILPENFSKRGNSVSTAQVSINGTFNTVNLQANVSLVYTTGEVTQQSYILQTTGPGAPIDAVNNYNNALLPQPSTQKPDFATVYNLTSQGVTNGYTEAQFAQLLQQQEQSVGKITAISVVSTSQIITDPAGITYFTEKERVTKTKNNTSRTDTFTSVFVVEDGVWKFWFSHPS
jgi:hypothetical protein